MFFGGGGIFGNFGNQEGEGDQYEDQDDDQIDNQKYYEILGVTSEATQEQIEEAYTNLIKESDPQKEEEAEKLQLIKQAYATLRDPQKRMIYDKIGSGEEKQQSDYTGLQGDPGSKKVPKMQPTKLALQLNLEQIYKGETIEVPNARARCCQHCNGKGGQNVTPCKACNGQGAIIKLFQLGPGMYTQAQQKCEQCQGEGDIIGQGGKCATCEGKKIVKQQCVIKVAASKGIPHNQSIVVEGEGNQIPNTLAGDVIFIAQEQPHQHFTRKGADLQMKKSITLLQALVGFSFKLKHLDGEEYVISSQKGEVIGDSHKKVVLGLGMPFFKDPTNYGNLIIEFTVEMPKRGQITKESLQKLTKILPGTANLRPVDHNYEMLEDFDLENVNTNEEGGRKDEEQEDGGQGQGVQCSGQ